MFERLRRNIDGRARAIFYHRLQPLRTPAHPPLAGPAITAYYFDGFG